MPFATQFNQELRVSGLIFTQIWLISYKWEHVRKYAIMVEDPVFGKFELSNNMIVEWKLSGRWYQTAPSLVIDQLLCEGEVCAKKAQRN